MRSDPRTGRQPHPSPVSHPPYPNPLVNINPAERVLGAGDVPMADHIQHPSPNPDNTNAEPKETPNPLIKATHHGTLEIGDVRIPCYVLADGRRMITNKGVTTSMGMGRGGRSRDGGCDRLANFTLSQRIKPHVSSDLASAIAGPVKFRLLQGGAVAFGYEAWALADLCDAVLEARTKGTLQKQQLHIAERCEVLLRAFAKVGITALIDEATGYQYARDRDELNRILGRYISQDLMPWTKRFPDSYYQEMYRLLGWSYSPGCTRHPSYVGTLTNRLVYERLPAGVLAELRAKNPADAHGRRKHKHHQFLTGGIGHTHLERHLLKVITLMQASESWAEFTRTFQRVFPGPGDQLDLSGIRLEPAA